MAVPDKPITRLEQYWDAILQKIQGGGGSSVTIQPLSVTENGTTTAPSGTAYSPVTVNVPNPNSTRVITGTLERPFNNEFTHAQLKSLIDQWQAGGVTLTLTFTALEMGILLYATLGIYSDYDGIPPHFMFTNAALGETVEEAQVMTVTAGTGVGNGYALMDGTVIDFDNSGGLIDPATTETTLTIYYHPMPSNE